MMIGERSVSDESLTQTARDRLTGGEIAAVLALMLTAIALRLLMLKYATAHITSDGVSYVTLGRNLISGNFKEAFSTYWPPLYPVLVALFSIATGDVVLAGRLVSVLSGGLLIIPQYFLARNLYDKSTALIAALLTLIYPFLLGYSTFALTECLYALLFMLAILSGMHALCDGNRRYFLLTGLTIGGCYLVRPEAFGFALLMIVLIIGLKLISRSASQKDAFANALLFSAGFLLLSFPYVLYLRSETGRWGISEKLAAVPFGMESRHKWGGLIDDRMISAETRSAGDTVAESTEPEISLQEEPRSDLAARLFVQRFRELPWRLYREYSIHLPRLMTPAFIFLAGLGLFAGPWSSGRARRQVYLLIFVAATLVGYGLVILQTRYFIALVPILLCWASMGVIALESLLCEAEKHIRGSPGLLRRHRIVLRSLLVLGLAISLLPAIVGLRRPKNADQRDRQLAQCAKAQSDPQPRFMAATGRMAFFADGRHIYLTNEDFGAVMDYARDRKIDFLVIEEIVISRTPKLRFLLDDSQLPPGLQLICQDDTPGERVRIFSINPAALMSRKRELPS